MKSILYPAATRGTKDIGWLVSKFTFSFAEYRDPTRVSFGSLVAFNDDVVQPGKGFGTHPHQNMEIVSVMLQGKMNHKDSMGYSTEIEAGGVQIMGAGEGLFHEEYNIGNEEVHFLQIWILPKLQNTRPRYQQRYFERGKRVNQLKTIVSNEEGTSHCWINQNAKLSLGYFDQASTTNYTLNPENKCVFVFVIAGSVMVGNQQLQTRDSAGFWETDQLTFVTNAEAEYLVIETVINQK